MKSRVLEEIRIQLRQRLDRLARAAMDAHAAATDPGSKAESKYDTRSLEASYLAAGQARQVDELAASIRLFDGLELTPFSKGDAIDAGALVELANGNECSFFLLVPGGGGMDVAVDGREVTLLSPDSPLYRKLLDLRVGDEVAGSAMTVKSLC